MVLCITRIDRPGEIFLGLFLMKPLGRRLNCSRGPKVESPIDSIPARVQITAMRGIVFVAGLAAILLWAGYTLWRDPRVQDLLRAPAAAGGRAAPASSVGKSKGAIEKQPAVARPDPARPRSSAPPAPHKDVAHQYEAPPANTIPNANLSRILLQILAARKLAQGISLSVSDQILSVGGTVDSEQKKRAIVEILEKARESRIIDASDLMVIPEPPDCD